MTEEQTRAIDEAKVKIAAALDDIARAMSDDGEPEIISQAIVLLETTGLSVAGNRFDRQMIIVPEEYQTTRSQRIGLLEMLVPVVRHSIMCDGDC